VANVGQITNLASIQLAEEGYGSPSCIVLLATGAETLVAGAKQADDVLVLDGCPVTCAKKIADEKGVPVAQHIVVTELGIANAHRKSTRPTMSRRSLLRAGKVKAIRTRLQPRKRRLAGTTAGAVEHAKDRKDRTDTTGEDGIRP